MNCPKCHQDSYYVYPVDGVPFQLWRCSKCGHEEEAKRDWKSDEWVDER